MSEAECMVLFDKAHSAGQKAIMRLSYNQVGYGSYATTPTYCGIVVPDCSPGSAWVNIRSNQTFQRFLKKKGIAVKGFIRDGILMAVTEGNNYKEKTEYAIAFTKVLVKAGVKALSGSRGQ